MRNDMPAKNHWVAFKLEGNGETTNRDAIGARVELILKNPKSKIQNPKSIQTLRAGEGFISQSSKWVHFGLGTADEIERVTVRWPAADGQEDDREEFSGLSVDRRYRLVQGSGIAVRVAARDPSVALEPSLPQPPPATSVARIPVVSLFGKLELKVRNTSTGSVVATRAGKSVLVNLWASWCTPCLKELEEFSRRSAEIRAHRIDIMALSVDAVDKQNGDPAAAKEFIRKIAFPFGVGMAREQDLKAPIDTLWNGSRRGSG